MFHFRYEYFNTGKKHENVIKFHAHYATKRHSMNSSLSLLLSL